MASVTKDRRGKSKYWICCFTAADGRQLKRSTRATDKTQALRICLEWEQAESLGKRGALDSEAQFRRVFNAAYERVTGKRIEDPSIKEYFERWLKNEQAAVSPGTFTRYRQILTGFLKFLGTRAEVRIEAITTDDLLRYRDILLAQGLAPHTVNVVVRKVLKRPFQAAVNEGLLYRNPVSSIRHMRDVSVEKGVFTGDELRALLAASDPEWRGLILAGYFTGARLGDLSRLKWSDIDLVERSITFTQKKTGSKIKAPIHRELLDYLLSLSVLDDDRNPIFPRLSRIRGPGKSGLSTAFKRLMASAGIKNDLIRQRAGQGGRSVSRLSFHSLRHSFVSALANANVPAELRRKLSGHADDKSHQIYTHHEFILLQNVMEQLPRLTEEHC